MLAILIVIVVLIVSMTVIPTVVREVTRAIWRERIDRVQSREVSPGIEERLARMEEAIDTMAVEIDRLRSSEERRYVSGGGSKVSEAVNPDDRFPPA